MSAEQTPGLRFVALGENGQLEELPASSSPEVQETTEEFTEGYHELRQELNESHQIDAEGERS